MFMNIFHNYFLGHVRLFLFHLFLLRFTIMKLLQRPICLKNVFLVPKQQSQTIVHQTLYNPEQK